MHTHTNAHIYAVLMMLRATTPGLFNHNPDIAFNTQTHADVLAANLVLAGVTSSSLTPVDTKTSVIFVDGQYVNVHRLPECAQPREGDGGRSTVSVSSCETASWCFHADILNIADVVHLKANGSKC